MPNTTSKDAAKSGIKRYELLTRLIDMSLKKSRKALNVEQLVQETYGEDASVYGGNDMLHGIVHNMLDKMDETTKKQMDDYLKEQLVQERLERIEHVIAQIEDEEQRQQEEEEKDYESAHQALDQTLLPPTVSLEDVLVYAAYQKQLEQKENMTNALHKLEEEIQELEEEHKHTQQQVLENAKTLQDVAKTLEQSADLATCPVNRVVMWSRKLGFQCKDWIPSVHFKKTKQLDTVFIQRWLSGVPTPTAKGNTGSGRSSLIGFGLCDRLSDTRLPAFNAYMRYICHEYF
eukprot:scaffold443_cov125-Cylindrotheca_fusiformis.AAC.8